MSEYKFNRRELTQDEVKKVKFWQATLRESSHKKNAADELYAIGVGTRGAFRNRGSVARSAPNRFVSPINIDEMLVHKDIGTQNSIIKMTGEWGGKEHIPLLTEFALDPKPTKGYLSTDAVGMIGGSEGLASLKKIAIEGHKFDHCEQALRVIWDFAELYPGAAAGAIVPILQQIAINSVNEIASSASEYIELIQKPNFVPELLASVRRVYGGLPQ